MSPLLGAIGGISEYNYRGNLDDWPNPFIFGNLINVEPGLTVGVSTVITGINYKSIVTTSPGSQVSVRNIIGITSIYSGDSNTPSSTATVSIAKSSTELKVGTNIRILNTSDSTYNGVFVVSSVIDSPYVTRFTYELPGIASTARPGISTAEFNYEVYPFAETGLIYIRNGQILEVRLPTTSGNNVDFDKQYRTTVKVGKRTSDWSVRTRSKDSTPEPFFFNNLIDLNVGIATTSNSITLAGLEPGIPVFAFISSGIGSFSLNGSAGVTTANVNNGDIIFMNEVTSQNYLSTKTSFITVGTYTTSFSVTTRVANRTPVQFAFDTLVNVPINQDQVSITTSLTGADNNIPLPASVSSPGQLQVNSDNYISGSTEVFNGDNVKLKIPASAIREYGTTYSTSLSISGISNSFVVTTRPRPIKTFPDQFTFTDIPNASPSSIVESSLVTLSGMTVGVADTGLATISGGGEFRVYRNGSLIRDYSSSSFPVKNSDQIQLKTISAGEGSTVQQKLTVSGVDTREVISGINGSTSDTWDVVSRFLSCKINQTAFNAALSTVSNAKIRELKSTSFTVSGLDNGCDTIITTSNPDSYIRNQNGTQVTYLQPLDIKNGDVITIYMTAAAIYDTNKSTTIVSKRRNGSDLVSGTWTIRTQVEDRLPDPFNLILRNQNNVSPCTYRSTFVTESLSGLSEETVVPATVRSTNSTAQISKNGGTFGTSIDGGVKNGDRIDIRLKSNCEYGGSCESATVTVGERSEDWVLCPEQIPQPTVNLQANSTSIDYNGSITLTWTSTFATSVKSSSGTGFVGIGSTQGTITINNLKANTTYSITIANSRGYATSSVDITVASESPPTVTLTSKNRGESVSSPITIKESTFANNRYVFVGGCNDIINPITSKIDIKAKGYIFTSLDGSSWDAISPNNNESLSDVTYGLSTFVAVGTNGSICISNDNWQTSSSVKLGNDELITVSFGNNRFIAGNKTNAELYISTNSTSWARINYTLSDFSNFIFPQIKKIRYLNGNFYLLLTARKTTGTAPYGTTGLIYRSSDGTTWQRVYTSPIGSDLNTPGIQFSNIIYDGERFIAIGNSNSNIFSFHNRAVLTSLDGINWSISYSTFFTPIGENDYFDYVSSNGTIIIVSMRSENSNRYYLRSTNGGSTWKIAFTSNPIYFRGPISVNTASRFVSIKDDLGSIFTTLDGTNWTNSITSLRYQVSSTNTNPSIEDSLKRTFNITSTISPTWSTLSSKVYKSLSNITTFSLTSSDQPYNSYRGSDLTWTSTNATSVVSTTGTGFSNITQLNGAKFVTPLKETSYSITVQNSSGVQATSSTTVLVDSGITAPVSPPPSTTPAPTATLSSNTTSIDKGGSVTLTWSSTDAIKVESYSGFGFAPTSTSGSLTVNNIQENTSYSITVSGPGGIVISNVINVILNSPTVTLHSVDSRLHINSYDAIEEGIYANSRYVFVGGYDTKTYPNSTSVAIQGKSYIYIASNAGASSWDVISPNITEKLRDITYGASKFVSVGDNGSIISSSDNFTTISNNSLNLSNGFSSVAFGSGKFVGLLNQNLNFVYTSTNGISWTQSNITFSPPLYSSEYGIKIRYFNGYFFLLTTRGIHRSSNGTSWIRVYDGNEIGDICYDGTNYIAVGSKTIVRSTDGITWTTALQITSSDGIYLGKVSSNGSRIIAFAFNSAANFYYTSTDGGITWSKVTITLDFTVNKYMGPVVYDGTKFVCLSNSPSVGKVKPIQSTDGINWTTPLSTLTYETTPTSTFNSIPDSLGRYFITYGTNTSEASNFTVGTKYYRRIQNITGFYIDNYNNNSSLGSGQILFSYYGGSSDLTWTSTNATTVVSTSGSGFTKITALNGTTTVKPTSTTTYSITVKNAFGVTATSSVTIFYDTGTAPTPAPTPTPTPTPSATAPTVTLSSNTTSIERGGSVTLTWSSTNAASVSSYTGLGFVPTSTSGSVTVNNITQNASYSITVTGPGGTVTSNTISVAIKAPTITLSASPTTVDYNGSTTLTWSSTNATSVDSSNFGASSVGGSLTLSNLTTTTSSISTKTYSITVRGPGGTATASVDISILPPPPVVKLTASQTSVSYNGSVTLTWSASGGTNGTSNFTSIGVSNLNGGSVTLNNLTTSKNYYVKIYGIGGQSTTASVDITVLPQPPTINLCATTSADPLFPLSASCGSTKTVGYGAKVSLSWTSTNATSVVSTSGKSFTGITAVNGGFSLPYSYASEETYSITVSGPGGTATDSIKITPTACIPTTGNNTFSNYKLGTVIYNNGTKDPLATYHTSSTSYAISTKLSNKPTFTFDQVQTYISNYYRNNLGRPVDVNELSNWVTFFNTSSYTTLSQLDSNILNNYNNVTKEAQKVSASGGRKGVYDTCNNIWTL